MAVNKKIPVKKKHPKPALEKKQKVLNTVEKARRQLAAVRKITRGGNERFIAYTNLLSSAYAAKKPNNEVIKLINSERNKLINTITWPEKKPLNEKGSVVRKSGKKIILTNVEITQINFNTLKKQLKKANYRNSQNLIHLLVADTPRSYAGIIAVKLCALAKDYKFHFLKKASHKPGFLETIVKLYSASGTLYHKKRLDDLAEEMFVAADVLKVRMRDF